MRPRRIILWSTSTAMLLLLAVLCWLWFADLGVFKPRIEQWVSETTGREFTIDGPLEINLGRESIIVAEGIRLGNAKWSDQPDMLSIERIEVRLDTFSLFGPTVIIRRFDMTGARIDLQENEDGLNNWTFDVISGAPADTTPARQPGALIRNADIRATELVYRSPTRTGPLALRIATFALQYRDDDFLDVSLDAQLGAQPVQIHTIIGSWDALLAQENVQYTLEGQFANFDITSKGELDDLASPARPSLEFALTGPDVNDLLSALQLETGGSGDVDLSGSLKPLENGPMMLDVQGRLGQAMIDATGSLADLQDPEQFDLKLKSSGPDLGRLLSLAGIHMLANAPFEIEVDASRQGPVLAIDRAQLLLAGSRFDLNARLPSFPGLASGTADLQVNGPDLATIRELLQLPGNAEGPFSLDLRLAADANGDERVRLTLTSALGDAQASGRIVAVEDFAGSEFDFDLTTRSLAGTGKAFGIDKLPDVAASANGAIVVEKNAVRLTRPLAARVDDVNATFDGQLSLATNRVGSQLGVTVRAPNLARFTGLFTDSNRIPPLPADLSGTLRIEDSEILIDGLTGTVGRSEITIDAALAPESLPAGSNIKVSASGPAFEEWVAHLPGIAVTPGSYRLSGAVVLGRNDIRFHDIALTRERGNLSGNVLMSLVSQTQHIDFDLAGSGKSVHAIAASLGSLALAEAPFVIAARGKLRNQALSLEQFDVELGKARLKVDGALDLSGGGSSSGLDIDLNIPDLADFGSLDQRRFRPQQLIINASVEGDRNTLRIPDLSARLGTTHLQGSVLLKNADIPDVTINLSADSIELGSLLEPDPASTPPATQQKRSRLIPDKEIAFDAMKRINAAVTLDFGELRRGTLLLKAVRLNATLRDGGLTVGEAGFDARSGWLEARATLEPDEGRGKATLAIKAQNFASGFLGFEPGPNTRADLNVDLSTTGTNVRALAANANGALLLDAREFELPNDRLLKRFFGDLLNEIIGTINPFAKNESRASISCVVLPIEIINGQLRSAPQALVQTDTLRIVAQSSVDLKTERIEMDFNSTPRSGITISAGEIFNPYVKVVGTLAAPRLTIDKKASLLSGGAAFATGGLSILAKAAWSRLAKSDTPCETAVEDGRKLLQGKFAELPTRRQVASP